MAQVISFAEAKRRREAKDNPEGMSDTDLGARIERIKNSITRINQLMCELKEMSKQEKKD